MDRKDAPIYAYVARLEAREKAQKRKRALTGVLFLIILVGTFIVLTKFEKERQFTEAAVEDLTPHQVRTLLEKNKLGIIVNHNYGEDTVLNMEGYFRLLEELAQKESPVKEYMPDDEWIYESESMGDPSKTPDEKVEGSISENEMKPFQRESTADLNANKRLAPDREVVYQDEGVSRSDGQQRGYSQNFPYPGRDKDGQANTQQVNGELMGENGIDDSNSVVALPAIPRLRADKMPYFPGGEQAIRKYLFQNKRVPAEARESQIHGTVYVRFVVNEDGSLGYPKVIKGLGYGCDEEALRLVRHMPRWQAGEHNGRRVPIYETLTITF